MFVFDVFFFCLCSKTPKVVENVPIVDEGVKSRLCGVLSQIFGRCGKIAEDGIFLPTDPKTGKTPGFCIIEYCSEENAKTAVKILNNLPLDKGKNKERVGKTTNNPSLFQQHIPLKCHPINHW